jgi:hypothetical protein
MRFSLQKTAHAALSGAANRKSGYARDDKGGVALPWETRWWLKESLATALAWGKVEPQVPVRLRSGQALGCARDDGFVGGLKNGKIEKVTGSQDDKRCERAEV